MKTNILALFLLLTCVAFSAEKEAVDSSPAKAEEEITEKGSVLITGANRGLGLELVKQFLSDGYTVYGTARSPERATELKETGAQVLALDVTSQESIDAMVATLDGAPIDILINNAGYFGPKLMTEKPDTIETVTREEMELCLEVNTNGPIFVTQALLPNLKSSKEKKVVNMSTRASIITNGAGPGAVGYQVSKQALNMVTNVMHAGLHKQGFIVVSVAPGHNKTDMGTERGKLDPAKSMAMLKGVIEGLTPKQSGGFWYYNGKRIAW